MKLFISVESNQFFEKKKISTIIIELNTKDVLDFGR
jgi:hypothetical protein